MAWWRGCCCVSFVIFVGWLREAGFADWRMIQALQNAVDRLSKYIGTLEDKMEALERKKK